MPDTAHEPTDLPYTVPPSALSSDGGRPMSGDLDALPHSDDWHSAEADRIWGVGQWVKCPACPPDSFGNPVRHHKDAHR